MPKVKYNNSDVEPGGEFKPFPIGLYNFTVDSIEYTESKRDNKPMLAIVLEVAKGEHKTRKVWEYIKQDESQAFRMRQFTDAIGTKPDGEIDYNDDTKMVKSIGGIKIAKMKLVAKVKVEPANEEFDASNKIKNFLPKGESVGEEVEEEEIEEEVEEAEAEEPEEDEDGEVTHAELAALDRKELKAWAKENESEVKFTKGKSTEDALAEICEEFGIEVEEAEEEEEEEEEAEDEAPDYEAMSLAELKEAAEEQELNPKGTKKVLINRLKKAAKATGATDSDPF